MTISDFDSPLEILLAVDDSPYSAAAVELLTRITWPAGTSARVLAVVNERGPLSPHLPNAMDQGPGIHSLDWIKAQTLVTHAAKRLHSRDLFIETEIYAGQPTPVILQRAEELLANLIVIGAKALNAPVHFRLGSTIESVAHRGNYSVLVARPGKYIRPLRTILAVDGSPQAQRAIEFLCTLSPANWARVTVLNVFDEKVNLLAGLRSIDRQPTANPLPVTRQVRPCAAEACTVEVIKRLQECGARGEVAIRFGEPADEILSTAQKHHASLIVIGMHRQIYPEPFRLDDVAQKVIKNAACSVLVVR
jgi:nucleotide-binding universal stress UspA family protein